MTNNQIPLSARLGSMLVDHFIMTLVALLFFIPAMILMFAEAANPHAQPGSAGLRDEMYIFLIGLAVYLCKDCLQGRSIAKRMFRLQVVDNSTGMAASPLKCFARNILCFLWPVEIIVTLANPSRRIGDMVAGTKVVPYEYMPEHRDTNPAQVILALVLAYVLIILVSMPLNEQRFLPSGGYVKYDEQSYDQQESEALMQLYTDSLGQFLSPDIRVYDRIENNNRKYVSIVMNLTKDYLQDEDSRRDMDSLVMPLLHSRMPAGSYRGQLKYIYKQPGKTSSRSRSLE